MSYAPKREIQFPADSVEATQPLLKKRRRVTHRELGTLQPLLMCHPLLTATLTIPPISVVSHSIVMCVVVGRVDLWRVLMSLRSGQLIDSAWALDALSILLFDDQTVVFFGLKHVPGLLDAILDHFRCYLHQLFESTSSTSASDPTSAMRSDDVTPASANCGTSSTDRETSSSSATRLPEVNAAQPEVSCQELPLDFSSSRRAQRASSNNYTHRTRCGKSVKVDSTAHAREHLHLMAQPAAASCDAASDVDVFPAATDVSTFETLPHVHTHMESHGVAEVLRRRFAAHLFPSYNFHTLES